MSHTLCTAGHGQLGNGSSSSVVKQERRQQHTLRKLLILFSTWKVSAIILRLAENSCTAHYGFTAHPTSQSQSPDINVDDRWGGAWCPSLIAEVFDDATGNTVVATSASAARRALTANPIPKASSEEGSLFSFVFGWAFSSISQVHPIFESI